MKLDLYNTTITIPTGVFFMQFTKHWSLSDSQPELLTGCIWSGQAAPLLYDFPEAGWMASYYHIAPRKQWCVNTYIIVAKIYVKSRIPEGK